MWIAGAGRGLGARLMVEVTLDPKRGYRPLRNEKPRMGVRGWFGRGGWRMAYLEVTSRSRVWKAREAVAGTTPFPRSRSLSTRLVAPSLFRQIVGSMDQLVMLFQSSALRAVPSLPMSWIADLIRSTESCPRSHTVSVAMMNTRFLRCGAPHSSALNIPHAQR